jgi:hypothetical protein
MALDEFWMSLRTAASLYSPVADTDAPVSDPAKLTRMLREAEIWLTPGAVGEFREEDFDFLPTEEQSILRENVSRFLAIAEQVPGNQPASPEQSREAREAFGEILRVLRLRNSSFKVSCPPGRGAAGRWVSPWVACTWT